MESKVNYTLVGLFVIILAIAIVAVAAWLTAATDARAYERYRVYVNESVAGLNLNASVKYKGVDVGEVSSIDLAPEKPDQVELILRIEKGTPIREETMAKLVSQGITGLAYVELSGGGTSPPLTAEDEDELPVIKSGPSLVARAEEAFNNLYVRLDELLSEKNLSSFAQTLDNLQTISAAVAASTDRIETILADVETVTSTLAANRNNLDQALDGAARTFQNSAAISAELNARLEALTNQVDAALGAVETAGTTLTDVGEEFVNFVDKGRGGLNQLAQTTAPALNELLANLERLAATLESFTRGLDRNPRRLLFGGPSRAPGPGE